MDPLKTVLVIVVSFFAGAMTGGMLLFVFEERYNKDAGDVYLEEDDVDSAARSRNGGDDPYES